MAHPPSYSLGPLRDLEQSPAVAPQPSAASARDLTTPLNVESRCCTSSSSSAVTEVVTSPKGLAATFGHIKLNSLKDVDEFVEGLYRFWQCGGLEAQATAFVGQLGALLFTQALTWLLLFAVNWRVLFGVCRQRDCDWAEIMRRTQPVSLAGFVWRAHIRLFQLAFVCFFLFSCHDKFRKFLAALRIRRFVVHGLDIPDDQALQSLQWPELLTLVVRSQPPGANALTAQEITHCLLRCDNMLVSWTEQETLTRHLPSWIPARLVYCRHMVWNLRLAIFFHLFDSKRQLNRTYVDNPSVLRLRLRLLGAVNLIFLAPILCCSMLFSAFQYAEELRKDCGQDATQRGFNSYSHWRLRCYNEPEHHVRGRLAATTEVVAEYLQLRPLWSHRSGVRSVVASCALGVSQFALSALLGLLFCMAVVDERPLLHVRVLGRPLLWHSLLLGGLLTAIRLSGSVPTPLTRSSPAPQSPQQLSLCNQLLLAAARLHARLVCVPATWRALYQACTDDEGKRTAPPPPASSAAATATRAAAAASLPVSAACPLFVGPRHQRIQDEICREMFSPYVLQLIDYLLSIVLSPVILGYLLPNIPNLQETMRASWVQTPRAGVVCAAALAEENEKRHRSALLFELSHRCWPPIGPTREKRKASALETKICMAQKDTLNRNPGLCAMLPSDLQTPIDQLGERSTTAAFFWLEEMERPCVVPHLLQRSEKIFLAE